MCNKYPCHHNRGADSKVPIRFAGDTLTDKVLDRVDYLKAVKQHPGLLQLEAQKVAVGASGSVARQNLTQPRWPQQMPQAMDQARTLKAAHPTAFSASSSQPRAAAPQPTRHQFDVAKIPEPTLVSKPVVVVHRDFKSLIKGQSPAAAAAKATFSANPIPSKRKNSMPKRVTAAAAASTTLTSVTPSLKEKKFVAKALGTNPLKLVIKRCGPSPGEATLQPATVTGPPRQGALCVKPQQGSNPGPAKLLDMPLVEPITQNQPFKPEASINLQSSLCLTSQPAMSAVPTTSISPVSPAPSQLQQDLPFEMKCEIKTETEIKTEIKEEVDDFWPDLPLNPSQVQLDEILRRDIKREMLPFEEQERLQNLMNNVAPVAPPCGCIQAGNREGNYGIYYNQLGYGRDLVQIR